MLEKLCLECGHTFVQYSTLNRLCNQCTYNKYAKPQKPIKRMGKVAKAWSAKRKEWIDRNSGPWACYICFKHLEIDELQLDHIQPRSHRPDLRYEDSNLAPVCWECNNKKGSKHD